MSHPHVLRVTRATHFVARRGIEAHTIRLECERFNHWLQVTGEIQSLYRLLRNNVICWIIYCRKAWHFKKALHHGIIDHRPWQTSFKREIPQTTQQHHDYLITAVAAVPLMRMMAIGYTVGIRYIGRFDVFPLDPIVNMSCNIECCKNAKCIKLLQI